MKTFLISTTEQLAAVLAHFRSTIRAKSPRPEEFEHRRRRHAPLPADPLRVPAYLRRRRLPLRLRSRFDAQALTPGGRRAPNTLKQRRRSRALRPRFGRQVFGDEMPRRQRYALDLGLALGLPQGQRVEQGLHHATLAPQHQGVAGDAVAGRTRSAIVFEVDSGAGTVVLAGAVDGLGAAEARSSRRRASASMWAVPLDPQPPSFACR